MLPSFKKWREGVGTPYVNTAPDNAFPDANIEGADPRTGKARPQKSANWFKPVPTKGTPAAPKGGPK